MLKISTVTATTREPTARSKLAAMAIPASLKNLSKIFNLHPSLQIKKINYSILV